jgi:RecA-family ATPase
MNTSETIPVYDFTTPGQKTDKIDITKYILDFSMEISDPVPIIKQGNTLVLSRGNLSVIAGAPKTRKSMFAAALVASFFGNNTFGLTGCVNGGKCLLFDTESSQSHTMKQVKRIYSLLNWETSNSNLVVFHLRECSISERIEIIKQSIDFYKPDWVIIDGLLDLVNSANDDTETNLLILELMRITSVYDCHLTNILHTGKSNGGQMLGWLGSYAQRKAETVFQLVKDGELTKVQPAETRNVAFEEFSFLIDENGIPFYNGIVTRMSKQEKKVYDMKLSFTKILAPNRVINYEALKLEYAEMAGVRDRTAGSHISQMLKENFIRKTDTRGYCLTKIESQ